MNTRPMFQLATSQLLLAGQTKLPWALALIVAGVSFAFRCWHAEEGFWLFNDQFNHWAIASRNLGELPLHGTPRMDGGWSYGPVYYLFLWTAYHVSAWLADPLPHYGGLAIGLFHVGAEVCLFFSLLRLRVALPWALGIALLTASSATEASLSHTLWNPNLAAAFFLLTLAALCCTTVSGSRRASLSCLVLGVLTIHCHTPSLFFVAPTVAAACWLRASRLPRRALAKEIALWVLITAAAHAPYWLSEKATPKDPTLSTTLASPAQALLHMNLQRSASFVDKALTLLLAWPLPQAAVLLLVLGAACLLSVEAWRRTGPQWPLAVALLAGGLATWLGWAIYPKDDLQIYWLCATQAGFAAAFGLAYATASRTARAARLAWLFPLLIATSIPGRFRHMEQMDRMPPYARLVRQSCAAAKSGAPRPQEELCQLQSDFLYDVCSHAATVKNPLEGLTPEAEPLLYSTRCVHAAP